MRPSKIAFRNFTSMDFIICVIGMAMFLEGFPYCAFPKKIKTWIYYLLELPEENIRIIGFLMMSGGLLLVYIGKS